MNPDVCCLIVFVFCGVCGVYEQHIVLFCDIFFVFCCYYIEFRAWRFAKCLRSCFYGLSTVYMVSKFHVTLAKELATVRRVLLREPPAL